MPKLNLDIFGSEAATPSEQKDTEVTRRNVRSDVTGETLPHEDKKDHRQTGSDAPPPKFIPVGFHVRHLSLLDDAVLKLRRSGYWKASKSEIIRNLIEAHAEDLDRFGRSYE